MKTSSNQAFTMVELLAALAIIAALVAILIPYIGDYINYAKQESDHQTLMVLNDALTRYKTQGGDLTALTAGASVGNILRRLQTTVAWGGIPTGHQFLRGGSTYTGASLGGDGEGANYKFTRYNSYATSSSGGSAGSGDESTPMQPEGVGYMEISDGTFYGVILTTGSSYFTAEDQDGIQTTYTSGTSEKTLTGNAITFWASDAAGNPVGAVQSVQTHSTGVTLMDLRSLSTLQSINLSGLTALSTLQIEGLSNLDSVSIGYTPLTSINLTGLDSLNGIDFNNCANLTSVTLPLVSDGSLYSIRLYGCTSLTSVDLGGNLIEQELNFGSSPITSLDISNQTILKELLMLDTDIPLANVSWPSNPDSSAYTKVNMARGSTASDLPALFNALPTFSSGSHEIIVGSFTTSDHDSIATSKGWSVKHNWY